jgi:hypothetical protein
MNQEAGCALTVLAGGLGIVGFLWAVAGFPGIDQGAPTYSIACRASAHDISGAHGCTTAVVAVGYALCVTADGTTIELNGECQSEEEW